MKNLSDGQNDGIVIMYCKNKIIYPVGLKQEQAEMLDLSLGIALQGNLQVFGDKPMGEIETIRKNK